MTFLETNIAGENSWLEDDPFLLGFGCRPTNVTSNVTVSLSSPAPGAVNQKSEEETGYL